MPTNTRFGFHGSGKMACTILPPPPGFHLSLVGCCVRPVTSYQSLPPLSLRKRPPGSTPHHRTSGRESRSGVTFHTRATLSLRSGAKPMPALDFSHFLPPSVLTCRSAPNHPLTTAAQS